MKNNLSTSYILKQHLNNSFHSMNNSVQTSAQTFLNKSSLSPNLNNQSLDNLTLDNSNDSVPIYKRQFQHRGASAHFMSKVTASKANGVINSL